MNILSLLALIYQNSLQGNNVERNLIYHHDIE